MQTANYPINIIGLGGFGESGIYYFGEGLHLSGQCLVFNDKTNLFMPTKVRQITIRDFGSSEFYENHLSALIENILLNYTNKEIFILAGGGGRLSKHFLEFLINKLTIQNFKMIVLISSPFDWEGTQRINETEEVISKITPIVKWLFKYDNEKMKKSVSSEEPASKAFCLVFQEFKKLITDFNLFEVTKEEIRAFLLEEKMTLEIL
ncbi:MAG: hypothetical protein GW805_06390 [Ignavibacteria bacterium]|nr:hypothetical protein [Ignavibacteria bacterium]NCS80780.1 hypothetical protein [Ignavibacteria bacterium]